MKVEETLHMVAGNGATSYASNSRNQEKIILYARPIVEKAIASIYSCLLPDETLVAADLGCSSGPNSFLAMSQIITAATKLVNQSHRSLELRCYLNDLPGNDFNDVFRRSPVQYDNIDHRMQNSVPYYVYGAPGSFHGRLFPRKSVHFFRSSSCLHWLSQVPPGLKTCGSLNKNNIYITESSPPIVHKLYLQQFAKDFSSFLRSRSEEITQGGQMVLSFLARTCIDPSSCDESSLWALLADALNSMVKEGIVKKERMDSFHLPFYTPSVEEVKLIIENEGSFDVLEEEFLNLNWDQFNDSKEDVFAADNHFFMSGRNIANGTRSISEPILSVHFGKAKMNELFLRYTMKMARHLATNKKPKFHNFIISLKAKW